MGRACSARVAFVLSGGASLGAIQAGMLAVLYERGIHPDLIVGTSAGALNGAFIASRPQTVRTADALGRVWRELRRGQAFPLSPVIGLPGFLGAHDHLAPSSGPTTCAASCWRAQPSFLRPGSIAFGFSAICCLCCTLRIMHRVVREAPFA